MPGFRIVLLVAGFAVLMADAQAKPLSGPVPLPRHRPAIIGEKARSDAAKPQRPGHAAPLSIAPTLAAKPGEGAVAEATAAARLDAVVRQAPVLAAPERPIAPFPTTTATATSPLDLTAVKQAIDLIGKNQESEATDVERSISDPVARKLVEWVILHSDNGPSDFSRYAAFLAANPSWPGIAAMRRRAEMVLWQQQVDPQRVIDFFRTEPPHTAKGHFALARALLTRGDVAGAAATVR
ncbi:MAG: lytic transglycosylase domain-containing protein, partial [Xanthobacteraceae bacterium]